MKVGNPSENRGPQIPLHRYRALLLDVSGTFMFNVDRFGPGAFGETYRKLGSGSLPASAAEEILQQLVGEMGTLYDDPDYSERFPAVGECLEALMRRNGIPPEELPLLEQVFAEQEVGIIPHGTARAVRRLGEGYRLGVVSNIWSRSDCYLREFRRQRLLELFEVVVFSSDHGIIKPSPKLFDHAVAALGIPRADILVVGDSPKRDVAGARKAGLDTLLLASEASVEQGECYSPDYILPDLDALARMVRESP